MKKLILPSDKILTNEHEVYSIDTLNKYYKQIAQDQASDVHPVSIIDISTYDPNKEIAGIDKYHPKIYATARELFIKEAKSLEEKIKWWTNRGMSYLICDGNHRAIAYELNKKDINTETLESYTDLKNLIKARKGHVPKIMRENSSFEEYLFKLYDSLSLRSDITTVMLKVYRLKHFEKIRIEGETIIHNPPEIPF